MEELSAYQLQNLLDSAQSIGGDELSAYQWFSSPDGSVHIVKRLHVGTFHPFLEFRLRLRKRYSAKLAREAKKCRTLDHEHIVKLFVPSQIPECCTTITQLHPNGNLLDWRRNLTYIDLQSLCIVIQNIFIGLTYLHSNGYVHGNIRENCLLFKTEQPDSVSIVFDTSIRSELLKLCAPSPMMEDYCPPEMVNTLLWFRNNGTVLQSGMRTLSELEQMDELLKPTKELDVWCVGVIAHRLLTGQYPFDADQVFRADSSRNNIGPNRLKHPLLRTYSPSIRRQLDLWLHANPADRATAEIGSLSDWFSDKSCTSDKRNLLYILEYSLVAHELDTSGFLPQMVEQLRIGKLNGQS
ncbi:uncharacterized protein DEA37_0010740 [Paragonimus westermani]|uniref:Protein kinase domain-containing protein n=1 Tax=Paragonimus westermani TaxID=34504 RepID=A0A5J4P1X7_9TREM|nr:uncharacterized protein DEA37_0010740 [Paragonimus westermani]